MKAFLFNIWNPTSFYCNAVLSVSGLFNQMQGALETQLCSYSSAPIWWTEISGAGSWACGVCSHSHLCVCVCSVVSNSFATPSTVAWQASLSMGFSRQEYWNGLPSPSPGDLPDPGTEPTSPVSPALASGFFTTGATWEVLGRVFFWFMLCHRLLKFLEQSTPRFPFTLDLASYTVCPGNLGTFVYSTCLGSIIFCLHNDSRTLHYSENLWFPCSW